MRLPGFFVRKRPLALALKNRRSTIFFSQGRTRVNNILGQGFAEPGPGKGDEGDGQRCLTGNGRPQDVF